MSLRSRVATWWRAVAAHEALDRQVEEELEFHIESYAEDLMRSGVLREQAMRRGSIQSALCGTSNQEHSVWSAAIQISVGPQKSGLGS